MKKNSLKSSSATIDLTLRKPYDERTSEWMNLAAKTKGKEDYVNSQKAIGMDISWVEVSENKKPIKEISYDRQTKNHQPCLNNKI